MKQALLEFIDENCVPYEDAQDKYFIHVPDITDFINNYTPWTPVEESLSEWGHTVDVLVSSDKHTRRVTDVQFDDSKKERERRHGFKLGLWADESVTHWMEVPAKPEVT